MTLIPSVSQNRSMHRLLIVDDDREIRDMLSEYLAAEGYSVESVGSLWRFQIRAASGDYALIILDVMLPGINGLDPSRCIRSRSQIPVLMLTARGEIVDRVVGLRLGADDYLAKPFAPQELAARLAAILRRVSTLSNPCTSILESGDTRSLSTGPARTTGGKADRSHLC